MEKELDRIMDYDRYCWNTLLAMNNEFQAKYGYVEKQGDRDKRMRKVRNSAEWQLAMPEYIISSVNDRLQTEIFDCIKKNSEITKTHSSKRYKVLKFRSKKRDKHSFTIPERSKMPKDIFKKKGKNYTFCINLGKKSVVPEKYRMMEIPELPFGFDENLCKILSVTILRRWGKYYVCFNIERIVELEYSQSQDNTIVGIDPGIHTTLTLSDGRKFSLPKKLTKLYKKYKFYQSRVDKRYVPNKTIQSKKYYDAKAKRDNTLTHIESLKTDWIHKITTKLANEFKHIKWEDVTSENFNKKDIMKRLKEYINQSAWGKIRRLLEEKCRKRKGKLSAVSPLKAATQTCSCCGYRRTGSEKLNLSERVFICPNCGFIEDRDINAAKNILKF